MQLSKEDLTQYEQDMIALEQNIYPLIRAWPILAPQAIQWPGHDADQSITLGTIEQPPQDILAVFTANFTIERSKVGLYLPNNTTISVAKVIRNTSIDPTVMLLEFTVETPQFEGHALGRTLLGFATDFCDPMMRAAQQQDSRIAMGISMIVDLSHRYNNNKPNYWSSDMAYHLGYTKDDDLVKRYGLSDYDYPVWTKVHELS